MHKSLFSSDSEEWYTPRHLIELVEQVQGRIGLDAASNSPPTVPALRHYTKEDDALSLPWKADTVFLNPPYGKQIHSFVDKLVNEYKAGNVGSAIALLPARTDTQWFSLLNEFPKCFVRGRIQFVGGESDSTRNAPFPSVFVYLGPDQQRFEEVFSSLGPISIDSRECHREYWRAQLDDVEDLGRDRSIEPER